MIRKGKYLVDSEGFMSKYKCRGVFGAKSEGNTKIRGVKRDKVIYIGRLESGTEVIDVSEYIKEAAGVSVISCFKLNSRVPNCSSFKISINEADMPKLFLPDIWPVDVECREFVAREKFRNNNLK